MRDLDQDLHHVEGGQELLWPAVKFLGKTAMPPRNYLGVSFNSLLVRGVRYDTIGVPLSVNT